MAKKMYMMVTKDKYELPIAVAPTIAELSRMTGISTNAISGALSQSRKNNYCSIYKEVVIDDD